MAKKKGRKGKGKKAQGAKAAEAAPKAAPKQKADGKMSGLAAAAKILAEAGEPLNSKEIATRALEKGLWRSDGKTPWATLYSAMLREARDKGEAARFRRAGPGRFELA